MGARADNCRRAIVALEALDQCRLAAQSPLYETEPVGLKDQAWFVNAVARLNTRLAPEGLLERLWDIERAMGRVRDGLKFGPRVLDLDILFFDDLAVFQDGLQIPHPRLHERRFVLQPLCDLAPDFRHPVLGRSVRSLLDALQGGPRVVELCP